MGSTYSSQIGREGRLPDGEFRALVDDARSRRKLSDIVGRYTTLAKRGARELAGLCCFHTESTASLEVNDDKGTYHCHGCGAGGDAITFLINREGLTFREAVEQLRGESHPAVSDADRAQRKVADATALQERIDLARSIWANSSPISGTPAEVYLLGRGIRIEPPKTVRYVQTPRWRSHETGEVGRNVPALVCAIQNAADEIVGVQCVFLDEGGRRKYERPRPDGSKAKAKLSFGVVVGGALRLGPIAESIVLCEGPEDGLTLMQMLPGRSIWVSCGTAGLSRVDLPSEVRSITLAGDNNQAGRNAVATAHAVFDAAGRHVVEVFPDAEFGDWNDQLRGLRK